MTLLDKQNYEFQWQKPIRRIGLDGKAVKGHQCVTTLTNLDKKALIGVLHPFSQKNLIQALLKIDKRLRYAVKEGVYKIFGAEKVKMR